MRKYEGKIQDNYDEYINENIKIGFMESFPVIKTIEKKSYLKTCRGFNVTVDVSLVRLTIGKDSKYSCDGLITNMISIAKNLPMGGFNSHSHADEAEVMESAIIDFCKHKDLMINEKICSWPFAKAVVSPNFYYS